jgi:hypothetical protein
MKTWIGQPWAPVSIDLVRKLRDARRIKARHLLSLSKASRREWVRNAPAKTAAHIESHGGAAAIQNEAGRVLGWDYVVKTTALHEDKHAWRRFPIEPSVRYRWLDVVHVACPLLIGIGVIFERNKARISIIVISYFVFVAFEISRRWRARSSSLRSS